LPEFATAPDPSQPIVVLDTNVALDWLLFANPQVHRLAQAIEAQQLRWISTTAMREELAEVLRRPPLCHHIGNSERILQTFDRHAVLVEAAATAPLHLQCRDRDDQKFIDLAVAHKATWLLSRDKALLELKRRGLLWGPQILTPAQWPGLAA
jgi:uncharacterized protein